MKTLILITLLLTTGCANSPSKYSAGDFVMMFLAAKANSTSTRDAYNRGLSGGYQNPVTVYQQEQFMNRAQTQSIYNDLMYGAGAVGR